MDNPGSGQQFLKPEEATSWGEGVLLKYGEMEMCRLECGEARMAPVKAPCVMVGRLGRCISKYRQSTDHRVNLQTSQLHLSLSRAFRSHNLWLWRVD
jgi:hypothetical protein